jgi:uncharacterized Fe-S cluster-containing radical SAM superfamily protein
LLARLYALPLAQPAWARIRKRRYLADVSRFLRDGSGPADRLPKGVVYEATMRCNLHCEFCYVGDLLNIEGQGRQELTIEALRRAFPHSDGLQVNLTGGEIHAQGHLAVLSLFEEKGYTCGCLTTNGTIITEERAEALADLALKGFLKHISVSINGPRDQHDVTRGQEGTFDRTAAGLRRLQAAARRKGARCASASTRPLRMKASTRSTRWWTSHRQKVAALGEICRARGIRFDMRPKVLSRLLDSYYRPVSRLNGRCRCPFNWARADARGGLERTSLRWTPQEAARRPALPGLPPLLQSGAVAGTGGAGGEALPAPRAIPLTVVL